MNQNPTALWRFAGAFYGLGNVEASLLALQDEARLDVPLLLALLHAGRAGSKLDAAALAQLIAIAHLWQKRAIGPLRKARRALARPIEGTADAAREALRNRVKDAELDAERLLLEALERVLPAPGETAPDEAIRANIGLYLAALARELSPESQAALAFLALEAARFR